MFFFLFHVAGLFITIKSINKSVNRLDQTVTKTLEVKNDSFCKGLISKSVPNCLVHRHSWAIFQPVSLINDDGSFLLYFQ